MILKALTLENFKGIREPVRIEFAPLTLLFGPNNAGKSTIVQALMYAREVLERNNCDAGRTVLGGDVVDLGGFENLVHGHDLSRVIRMRFELDLREASPQRETEWVRESQLDNRVDDFYKDAPKKLDVQSVERLRKRLVDVWVQIEIAWSREARRPIAQGYSVGRGVDEYARISCDAATGEASLPYFNFGIFPFGTRYNKGDATDFEWEFAKEVRKYVRQWIAENDFPERGIKKGAQVGMAGEEDRKSDNRLARQDFDKIVSQIISGKGAWGDSSVDGETGEHNPNYIWRQRLMEWAEVRAAPQRPFNIPAGLRLDLKFGLPIEEVDLTETTQPAYGKKSPADLLDQGDTSHEATQLSQLANADKEEPADEWDDWEERIEEASYGDEHEVDSWMLELFVALIRDGGVPTDPDNALPLRLRGSALPEWGRALNVSPVVWRSSEKNEFWEYPQFVQEHFQDLLTEVIVAPGEYLLEALKGAIYVSPFRAMPPRHYQPARSPDPRRWADGLAAWDWLLLGGKAFAACVNEWLIDPKRFDAGYEIDLRHYREIELDSPLLDELMRVDDKHPLDRAWLREEVEKLQEGRRLQIRNPKDCVSLFPQDLGVGVSQVLPVIVAALHSTSGIVAIEEPESNIHPKFQVVLADLFITQAKADPDLLFLVETHSEHLMLRCLRRIRETAKRILPEGLPSVAPDDVAVHFVESTKDGPQIKRIEIDEDGDFVDEWPGGFFEESFHEKFAGR